MLPDTKTESEQPQNLWLASLLVSYETVTMKWTSITVLGNAVQTTEI
jgi:hypothetical protein